MEQYIGELKNFFHGKKLSTTHLIPLITDGVKLLYNVDKLSGGEKKQALIKALLSMTETIKQPEKDILLLLITDVVPVAIDHLVKAFKTDQKDIVKDTKAN